MIQRLANGFWTHVRLARVSLVGAALLAMPSAWADTEAGSLQLIFGDGSTPREAGEVVVPLAHGYHLRGEEAFPAISGDGAQVAILYGSHVVHGGWALDIIDVERQISVQRFYINWSSEDQSPLLESEDIRARMEAANAYLEQGAFKTVELLFDLYHTQTYGYQRDYRRQHLGRELPEFWQTEADPWRVVYWGREDRLEIFDQDADQPAFSVALPMLGYQLHRESVCKFRPNPSKGWYDADADVLIVGLFWLASHVACDRPPRWLVARLRSTS